MINKENLLKLADYLDTVPQDQFDITLYMTDQDGYCVELSKRDCGTVACAVGHGPAAGISVHETDRNWDAYSHRAFGLAPFSINWDWCFSPMWHSKDNTPSGAAKRIRYMIEHGVPVNAFNQLMGKEPYMFDNRSKQMSNKQFKYYIATVNNNSGFLAEDVSSGGYPWQTSSPLKAKLFDYSDQPLEWLGSLASNYPTLQVAELAITVTPVSAEMFEQDRQARQIAVALAKLTDEEKRLLGLA